MSAKSTIILSEMNDTILKAKEEFEDLSLKLAISASKAERFANVIEDLRVLWFDREDAPTSESEWAGDVTDAFNNNGFKDGISE